MLNETQLRIIGFLLREPLHVSAIAQKCDLTPMAVSKTVRILEKERFVSSKLIGKNKMVSIRLDRDNIEYYSLAEKILSKRSALARKLKDKRFYFAIVHPKGHIVIGGEPNTDEVMLTVDEFLSRYKEYEPLLKGERTILNPYEFWKVMLR